MKMKFFIPFAETESQAEKILEATAQFIGNPTPEKHQMIYSVSYEHNSVPMTATVGKDIDTFYKEHPATVIAIFPPVHEGAPIKICLANRGVARGEPIYVNGSNRFTTFES